MFGIEKVIKIWVVIKFFRENIIFIKVLIESNY